MVAWHALPPLPFKEPDGPTLLRWAAPVLSRSRSPNPKEEITEQMKVPDTLALELINLFVCPV